jgi:LSD1 subclass zinc finger protein
MGLPFKCHSCGGPLEYDGGEITVRCEFCSNVIIVPEELRESFGRSRGPLSFLEQIANLKAIGRFIREGNLNAATKLYRDTFGVSPSEAKDAVQKLAGGNPVQMSSTFGAGDPQSRAMHQPVIKIPQSGRSIKLKGCSPFALALVIILPLLCVGASIAVFVYSGFRSQVSKPMAGNKKTSPVPGGDKSASGFASVILKFGSEGIGPGQFKDARTVAVDAVGHIYAADYTGGRVQVFDSNGMFLTQWLVDPKMPLLKLAADRKGIVYIVQRGDINRYDGMTGASMGKVETDGRSFDDVIVTLDGGLIAVQNNEDLVRFDAGGRVVSTIKKSVSGQSGDSELDAKVAVDGLGNTYAMGRFNNAVFKFAPDGRFLTRIGGGGDEPGLFRALNAIAVDGKGRIYVCDIKGVQVFDANGRYLDVFKIEKNLPFGLVFNDKNELFVAGRTQILKFVINK